MAVDDPFDTSDMPTARAHMKRLLVEWRDAGAPVDCLVSFLEGFVACKVSEMMKQREAYSSVETVALPVRTFERVGEEKGMQSMCECGAKFIDHICQDTAGNVCVCPTANRRVKQ
jgi:hypothetical protein